MSSYKYRASRNRFSTIIFHDYLHCCGIFLARFLITIVLNIISSLHIVFSLCARVGWCDVCTDFTNVIKVDADVDVNECHYWMFNTYNIRETIDSFARGPYYHLFKRYVFILLTKMRTETKTVPSTWYIFNVQGCTRTYFSILPYIVIGLMHEGPANSYREKRRVAFVSGHLFTFLVVLSLICLMTTQILICGIRLYEGLRFY